MLRCSRGRAATLKLLWLNHNYWKEPFQAGDADRLEDTREQVVQWIVVVDVVFGLAIERGGNAAILQWHHVAIIGRNWCRLERANVFGRATCKSGKLTINKTLEG